MDEKTLQGFLRSASKAYAPRFTRFLDPVEMQELRQAARASRVSVSFWGGYQDAERCIAASSGDEPPAPSDFPLVALTSFFDSRFGMICHRDVLGAYMSLGLTRDCIGDIIINNSSVYLFVVEKLADFVAESLTSAGRTALSFHRIGDLQQVPTPDGSYFRGTVSSLRLDTVISEAFRLSRSEAADKIHAGHVKVNHVPVMKTDAQVEAGALLSLAGTGRVSLRSIDGLTKKQRIGITFFRYK